MMSDSAVSPGDPVVASRSINSTRTSTPRTAPAHGRCAIPYGGVFGVDEWAEFEQFGAGAGIHRVLRQAVGGQEHGAQRSLRCRDGLVAAVAEQFAGFDRVEQVVDGVFGVGGDQHGGAVPSVRYLRCDQRIGEDGPIGGGPFVEAELGRLGAILERDRERPEDLVELVEERVDLGLDQLGDDDLVTLPCVGELGFGQRLGQLRSLIEVPGRHVIVDLDDLGVVGVEVDRLPGRCAVLLRLVPGLLVDESHG